MDPNKPSDSQDAKSREEIRDLDARAEAEMQRFADEGAMKITRIPPENVSIEPATHVAEALLPLLRAEPELCCQLLEALQTGRWLVLVAAKVREVPPDDLWTASTHHDFPIEDLVDALQAQCRTTLAQHALKLRALEGQTADPRRWK